MQDKVVETLAFQYLPSQSKTVTIEVMKMVDEKKVKEFEEFEEFEEFC